MKGQISQRLSRWGKLAPAEIEASALRLRDEALAASTLRSFQRDPSVLALTIERTRERTERGLVTAMLLMLAFTTYTVQQFVVQVAAIEEGTGGWWLAMGVEPGIILVVFTLMRQDQVARREGVIPGNWVRAGRWVSFAFTYIMNTALSFAAVDLGGIFLHSALPVLAFITGEAVIQGREALTQAAEKAARDNRTWAPDPLPEPEREIPVALPQVPPVTEPIPAVEPEPEIENEVEETADPDVIPMTRHPKGHLKNVRLPQVLRDLRAQGKSRDEITTAEVDKLLDPNRPEGKYVKRSMIESAWAAIENEEADDGAVNS